MADNEDLQHLNLLGIFHYVVGVLAALFALFPALHLIFGVALMSGAVGEQTGGPDARLVGGFMAGFALIFILLGLTFAGILIASGRFLRAHERHTYCTVVAAISCIFFPFGTVLGILTIIVLQRPAVKELFSQHTGAASHQ
ncbi:MAG: hypothetical protein KY432_02355 [Acidobacteria bacterium]|nr:hypothetical protein [Acidobacteriota bacterium]